jgi:hypothetical protein
LILVSIPLAIFAAFTTCIAFALLLIRVSIVYFELGIALLRSWLIAEPTKPRGKGASSPTPLPHRRRRSSVLSSPSSQEFRRPPLKSDSYVTLLGAGAPDRDYEGVGGWRVEGDEPEESLWISMNSRLELPLIGGGQRRHRRSLTGNSQRWTWSPEALKMSPVQSRARTPSIEQAVDEYFGLQPYGRHNTDVHVTKESNKSRRKSMNGTGEEKNKRQTTTTHARRKSVESNSSSSSGRSSKVTIKQTALVD